MASIASKMSTAAAAAAIDSTSGGLAVNEDACEELLLCARYGETEDLIALLDTENGAAVNYQNGSDMTALHYACANGHVECAAALVERGAQHLPNDSGNTPLHWAVQMQQLETVKFLLESERLRNSVDVLQKNSFGKGAMTEAFGRESTDITKALLEHSSAAALEKKKKKKKNTDQAEEAGKDGSGGKNGGNAKGEQKGSAAKNRSSTSSPEDAQIIQSKVHKFLFAKEKRESNDNARSIAVSIRELALDYKGKAFQGNDATLDATGLYVWSASLVLARWIAEVPRVEGMRVCELGAGCGLPGIAAAKRGASRVTLTDLMRHTVENLKHNADLNGCGEMIDTAAVDWNFEKTWPERHSFELVIGSDLVYDEALVKPLLSVILALLAKGGRFMYVAAEEERDGHTAFLAALDECESLRKTLTMEAPQEFYANPLEGGSQAECDMHFGELAEKSFRLHMYEQKG